ncbi:caspase, EACC1-associated type [Streptomyces geranii]|uniref:caspase, EACC1-associated type n=1 Tax=Streptomyces geranii TaxID=2058923 RepID=UPI000D02F52F|nr:Hsp70 family protein [Streptomyces geranii]
MANKALIIANSTYDDSNFDTLPAAAADAAALAQVLGAPEIGDFSVNTLVDVEQRTALRALESFFTQARPDDLLLLHLSLHGWKDVRNRLHFAMRDTERDYPGSTAISADMVGTWMGESRSRRIVVLLDCCYSGAFAMNTRRRDAGPPTVDVAEPFAGNGRVVLTASTALQYAHESEQDVRYSRTPAQPSVFTSAVVSGLRDGSADLDGDGLVSVDELYDYVHEQVRQRIAGQTPTLSVDSAQGTIYLARSPRHEDVDRLVEMRAAVLDTQPWKRIGSLHLVEQLLGSVREPTRDAARAALLGLIADGDREVARRARELWHARGLGEIPTARAPRPARPAPQRLSGEYRPVVGIDFGTTNSAIGLLEGEDVRLIPNAEGALTTPSLVAITAEGDILVGTAAKRQAITNPDYTVRSSKLKLGTGWSITRGGIHLTAEDAARLILQRLREEAETYVGGPLGGAVLTVPANFGLDQRAALVRAARQAGLHVFRVINEPTAAAITYGLSREEDSTVLIFDLGGGTLDVSLVEIGDGVVEVKATGGDSHLGGDDWDRRLVEYLVRRVRDRHGVDLGQDVPAMQRLQEAAEAAKVELSSATSATVTLPYLASVAGTPVHLDETLTRTQFEQLTMDLLDRCRRPVLQALRDAAVPLAELDQVILTGGATRMPAVGELVRELTGGKHPYRGLIPEGIVTGAALQVGILAGQLKDVLLLDVNSASLGVELHDGGVLTLLERNTTIPTRRHTVVATNARDQRTMVLRLVEGEQSTPTANRTLAVLQLSDLLPVAPRTPLVRLTVDIDANGLVHLMAQDLGGSGRQLAAKVRQLEQAKQAHLNSTEADADDTWTALRALEASLYTGREWKVLVDRSTTTEAATLVASPEWETLRRRTPLGWTPPIRPKPTLSTDR